MLSSNTRTNLPSQLTRFIGREREIAEVKRLLRLTRLLTLTGPGGCGKTRLAIQSAADLPEAFPDGVWFVELAALADPALVSQAIASIWDIREAADQPLTGTLVEYLQRKELLLVLDNCEHLISACAQLASTLLRTCPNLRILATSREAQNTPGETVWIVPSLSFPAQEFLPSLEYLTQYEAIRLFLDRATAVLPNFTLTNRNARAMVQVCQSLDGIPLALELAAARVRVLSLEQIAERLHDGFRLLTTASQVALPRHQTLLATIDWSYNLLTEKEQLLFRRLSVFAGGFTLVAAEETCAGEGLERDEVLDVLSRLVDKSLVVVGEQGPEMRYRLLETMRQYAQEKLRISAKLAVLQKRYAHFFLGLAEEIEPKLNTAQRRLWLMRLEVEHDNLRAVLAWSQTDMGSHELGLRLAGALWWFWFHRGYWSEGRRWLEGMLALPERAEEARAKALFGAGWLAFAQGDDARARLQMEESVAIWRTLRDTHGLAYSLTFLSQPVQVQGDHLLARTLAEEGLAIFRKRNDAYELGIALTNLGNVMRAEDDTLARPLYEESRQLFRTIGDDWALAMPLRHLGDVAFRQGDYDRAIVLYKESLTLCRKVEEKWFTSRALENLAGVVGMKGDYRRAARLFGAAEALREVIGAPVMVYYRPHYERTLAVVRAGWDEESFTQAWAEGRAMTLEQAFAYALDEAVLLQAEESSPLRVETEGPGAELRLFAFGAARVYRGDHVLTPSEGMYAKVRALLFYLLRHPSATKGQIGLALWPDASSAELRSSFHVTVHQLRQALGYRERIVFDHHRYAFNRHLPYWFDVETFESTLTQARQMQNTAPAEALHHLEQAVKLYQGDFLQDFMEGDWHVAQRERLRDMYRDALLTIGHLLFAQGRYAEAIDAYRRTIAHESYLETAHRELMRSYARLGEPGQALRHYQALVEFLRDEFGSPPAAETTALFESLRRGEAI